MAKPNPDLASSFGSGQISRRMGESGVSQGTILQDQESSSPSHPIPQNFVRQLRGGEGTNSAGPSDSHGDMAVGVSGVRHAFDPWNNNKSLEDEDGRCKGCTKISKVKAAARAAYPFIRRE